MIARLVKAGFVTTAIWKTKTRSSMVVISLADWPQQVELTALKEAEFL
jgi:hypothetical protein